jgi:hypothetical protein
MVLWAFADLCAYARVTTALAPFAEAMLLQRYFWTEQVHAAAGGV